MASDEKTDNEETESATPAPAPETDTSDAGSGETANADQTRDEKPEVGGRGGPDPTRFGDWEINGRCVDF